jgi:hypothetical protein
LTPDNRSGMAGLRVLADLGTAGGQPVRYAVAQVRDANLRLVAEVPTDGRPVRLPPGRYAVSAALPDGATGADIVDLTSRESATVRLTPALPPRSRVWDPGWDPPGPVPAASLVDASAVMAGDVPSADAEPVNWQSGPSGLPGGLSLTSGRDRVTFVQLSIPGAAEIFSALPAAPADDEDADRALVQLTRSRGALRARVLPAHPPTALALRYAARGLMGQAGALLSTMLRQPPESRSHPMAALGVAMLRLRLGWPGRARDALKIADEWPWIPDAIIFAAEWLARDGLHDDASTLLHDLGDLGIPIFTDAYGYAISRLRQYSEDHEADHILELFAPSVGRVEVTAPTLTFVADDDSRQRPMARRAPGPAPESTPRQLVTADNRLGGTR